MKEHILKLYTISLMLIIIFCVGCKDKQANVKVVVQEEPNQTKTEIKSTESSKKSILCFGNSLTAGFGLDEKEAWPYLLQMKLDSLQLDFKVINAGLSGETTSNGINRIDWVLNQKVDIFILELGANDMLRGLDVDKTKENLSAILSKVKTKYPKAELIIAGMLAPPNMGAAYSKKFNDIFPELSKKFTAQLMPFFLKDVAGIGSLNLPDGKHPNKKGQKIVLNNIWPYLEKAM